MIKNFRSGHRCHSGAFTTRSRKFGRVELKSINLKNGIDIQRRRRRRRNSAGASAVKRANKVTGARIRPE